MMVAVTNGLGDQDAQGFSNDIVRICFVVPWRSNYAAATMFAHAQPYGDRWSWSRGPGMIIGHGMMGRAGFGRMCNAGAIGFAEWRIGRIEQELKLTNEQRSKFDELKTASLRASEALRTACSSEIPSTIVGQMEAMDKRLDAMSSAVKTIRPALEAFYTALRDDQKAKLDTGEGHGRFWRWHGQYLPRPL